MSALPPKADICERIQYVCFVPKADVAHDACRLLGTYLAANHWGLHRLRQAEEFHETVATAARYFTARIPPLTRTTKETEHENIDGANFP
jgi:hypothetical protein